MFSVRSAILPQGGSSVIVNIANSTKRFSVTNHANGLRSRHEFVVKDSQLLWFGGATNLQEPQCIAILAAALAAIFDTEELQPPPAQVQQIGNQIAVSFEEHLNIMDSVRIGLSTTLNIEEQDLVDLCGRIVALNPYNRTERTLVQINMIDALASYQRAIQSLDPITAYTELSEALERVINRNAAAGAYLQGANYDMAVVAALPPITQNDIQQLRECYNRFKHGATNSAHQATLEQCRANLTRLVALTNRALRQNL